MFTKPQVDIFVRYFNARALCTSQIKSIDKDSNSLSLQSITRFSAFGAEKVRGFLNAFQRGVLFCFEPVNGCYRETVLNCILSELLILYYIDFKQSWKNVWVRDCHIEQNVWLKNTLYLSRGLKLQWLFFSTFSSCSLPQYLLLKTTCRTKILRCNQIYYCTSFYDLCT